MQGKGYGNVFLFEDCRADCEHSAQRRAQSGTVLASSDTFILVAQVNKGKLYPVISAFINSEHINKQASHLTDG